MKYNINMDSREYQVLPEYRPSFAELNHRLKDEGDFSLDLYDVFTKNFHFKWGNYAASSAKEYAVTPEKESLVVHLCLSGSCTAIGNEQLNVSQNQFLVFHEKPLPYLFRMGVNKNRQGAFFELSLSPQYLDQLFTDDNWTPVFHRNGSHGMVFRHRISTDLLAMVQQLHSNPYHGSARMLFWEAKLIELMLALSGKAALQDNPSLKPYEIECIHGIKDLLHEKYNENLTIAALAREAGINQTTLKRGFKELFGTTVFSYLTNVRMDKAKQLLLDGGSSVREAAITAGYAYPQHFTAAFRRKFGFTPNELKK